MEQGIPNTIGAYRVQRELGRGGMGVVYLAEDTRLGRQVAIKSLPEDLAQDPARLERFEREARLLAQLNHPNVAGIHGVEEQSGARFLVLEYVEGEDLAAMLDRGPLAVDEAVALAAQIAAGVEAAHEAGVIHRDLKPGNIIVTPTGQAKVLDFGLARSDTGQSTSSSAEAATLTTPPEPAGTVPGVVLGTGAYMSPEQARGRRVDRRTDVWSFGVVLFEMLAGASPFVGETVGDSIGAVLHKDPDFERLPKDLPPGITRVLRRCLARDRDERWRDMGDIRVELLASEEQPATAAAAGSRLATVIAALLALVAITLGALLALRPAPVIPELTVADIAPPEGVRFVYDAGPPAISPDGKKIAFVGQDAEGGRAMYIRELGQPGVRRLAAAEDPTGCFWSPDSESLGFAADDMLQRINIRRGSPDPIAPCLARGAVLADWADTGDILFTSWEHQGCIAIVPASGGEPRPVTEVDLAEANFRHLGPVLLPDGRHFLYTNRGGVTNEIRVGSIDGDLTRTLIAADSNAVFVEPDTVLYWRGGALRAHTLDLEKLELVGEPRLVAQRVRHEPADLFGMFGVSDNGVLVYHPEASGDATERTEMVLLDREGTRIGRVGDPGNYYAPRFSSDGRYVAVDNSGSTNNGDIWVYGVDSPVEVRLTTDPADESRPVWSPDDRSIAYFTNATGQRSILVTDLTAPGTSRSVIAKPEIGYEPSDWSGDGRRIAAVTGRVRTQQDIEVIDLETGASEELVSTPFNDLYPRLAPGSDWFAFESDETGQEEVYIAPIDNPSAKRRVSLGGGQGPYWRSDGLELFYRGPEGDVFSVAFPEGPSGPSGAPVALFPLKTRFGAWGLDYHVTADGQRFVAVLPLDEPAQRPMTLLINWREAMER